MTEEEHYGWKAFPKNGKLEDYQRADRFWTRDDAVDDAARTFRMTKSERERLRKEGWIFIKEYQVIIGPSEYRGIF